MCDAHITKQIINSVKGTSYFAIIADETSDNSHKEQLCLCIRYVHRSNNRCMLIKEKIVQFIPLDDLSAESIMNHILTCVARLELDINKCVRQGYDGTAFMSCHVSGFRHGFEKRRIQ